MAGLLVVDQRWLTGVAVVVLTAGPVRVAAFWALSELLFAAYQLKRYVCACLLCTQAVVEAHWKSSARVACP